LSLRFSAGIRDCIAGGIILGSHLYNMTRISTILLPFLVLSSMLSYSQNGDEAILHSKDIPGDTIPVVHLRQVVIYGFRTTGRREERQLTRLMKNVKKVYPYAKLAGLKMEEYQDILDGISNRKERKQVMKQVENEIIAEYGGELSDLTFSQGKILIKLIDRETGNTSYQIVEDFRGEFRAFFYQAFARIFGYDLKVKYDPDGEDREIETIVKMIENGQI
jgi:hypothetical protein